MVGIFLAAILDFSSAILIFFYPKQSLSYISAINGRIFKILLSKHMARNRLRRKNLA